MVVTFWGTRGSIPAPGAGTIRVGGNTTCLEVRSDSSRRIIVDAGTGIRPLGLRLKQMQDLTPIVLLFTHSHWDHLAGFTFFAPAYSSKYQMTVLGNPMALEVLQRDIFERRDNRYFPVNMDDFRARITVDDGELPKPLKIDDITVHSLNLNHPGSGFAYRFDHPTGSVAFITDNELGKPYEGGNTRADMVDFCRNVDCLIHDAQYLPSEIKAHQGWGHSHYEEVVELALEAGARRIYLTHHDPERDDYSCEQMLQEARKYISTRNADLKCFLAIEGESIKLG